LADVNANIGINFDTSQALAQLRQLQAGLSRFNQTLTQGNVAAMNAQKGLNSQLIQAINATGKFVATQKDVATSTSSFTQALEKNQMSMRQYFRYTAAAATQNTKVFKGMFAQERETLTRASKDRVKLLQSQYIQMQAANGDMIKVLQVIPKHLKMVNGQYTDYATRMQMAAQRQQFLNKLLSQGSTQLLNFGKNTQWAGRQLMVGLTIPLSILGSTAAKTFMEMEQVVTKFLRVYGDLGTSSEAANKAIADIQRLGREFTKYGIAVKDTVEMAGSAAAMGLTGNALNAQVIQATRLAVLGQVEQQQALETTISLTNAFGIATEELASKINFLNAVENQTVLSIEDLTIAIPKAGPVIKQLGGSVEDLAFFMTAMKEGGINASEGANALKSGLASMINPSKKASEFLGNLGINIKGLVEANKGDLKGTVVGFARALDTLDPLNRARAIEQLFGKFQFARLSTLFQNVTKDSSQAARALGLAGASVEELAILSERELGKVEDMTGNKFKKSMENLKLQLVPIGKAFLQAVTPIVSFVGRILEKFNTLSDGTKKVITIIIGVIGGLAPIALMTFGILMNGLANTIKLFAKIRGGIAKLNGSTGVLGGGFDYLTNQQIENLAQSNALHTSHQQLISTFNVEQASVNALAAAYQNAASQARALAQSSPGLFNTVPGPTGAVAGLPKKFATGGVVPGTGNKDTVPAMLTPGEVVLSKDMVKQNPELIAGIMNGTVKKYAQSTNIEGGGFTADGLATRAAQMKAVYLGTGSADFDKRARGLIEGAISTGEAGVKRIIEFARASGEEIVASQTEALNRWRSRMLDEADAALSAIPDRFASSDKIKEFLKGRALGSSNAFDTLDTHGNQNNASTFAHTEVSEPVPYEDALQATSQSANVSKRIRLIQAGADWANNLPDGDPRKPTTPITPQFTPVSAAGFDGIKQSTNTDLNLDRKNVDEFVNEFTNLEPIEKWRTSLENAGLDVDANAEKIRLLDAVYEEHLRTFASKNKGGVMGDSDLMAIREQTINDPRVDPTVAAAVQRSSNNVSGVRMSGVDQDQEDLIMEAYANGEIELPEDVTSVPKNLFPKPGSAIGGEAGRKKRLGVLDQEEEDRLAPLVVATPEAEAEAEAEGEKIGAAATRGVKKGAKTQSPSTDGIEVGKDIAEGVVIGLQEGEASVASQGAQLGSSAVPKKPRTAAETQAAVDKMDLDNKAFYDDLDTPEFRDERQVLKSLDRQRRKRGATGRVGGGPSTPPVTPPSSGTASLTVSSTARTEAAAEDLAVSTEQAATAQAQVVQQIRDQSKSRVTIKGNTINIGKAREEAEKAEQESANARKKAAALEAEQAKQIKSNSPTTITDAQVLEAKERANALELEAAKKRQAVAMAELEGKDIVVAEEDVATPGKIQKIQDEQEEIISNGTVEQGDGLRRIVEGTDDTADSTLLVAEQTGELSDITQEAVDAQMQNATNLLTGAQITEATTGNLNDVLQSTDTTGIAQDDLADSSESIAKVNRDIEEDKKKIRALGQQELAARMKDAGAIIPDGSQTGKTPFDPSKAPGYTEAYDEVMGRDPGTNGPDDPGQTGYTRNKKGQFLFDPETGQPTTLTEKQLKQKKVGMRVEKVSKFSGKISGGLGTAAMVAGAAGAPTAVTAGLGTAATVAQFAPMITKLMSNPYTAAATALAAVAVGAYALNKKLEATAIAIAKFTRATTVSADMLKKIGEQTGKVGASEIMNRRRGEGQLNTYVETNRKSTMESEQFLKGDAGKALQAAFVENSKKNGTEVAAEQFALQLAAAISDGTIAPDLGQDIATQMGINLKDSVTGIRINAELRKLIGPSGEDLTKDPLEVRTRIAKSASGLSEDLVRKYTSDDRSEVGQNSVWSQIGTLGLIGAASGSDKTAALAVASSAAIETAQAQADAMSLYYDNQLAVLRAQRETTTDKAKQLELDTKIKDLLGQQEAGMLRMNNIVAAQIDRQVSYANELVTQNKSKIFLQNNFLRDAARREDAYFDAQKADVKAKYKGTASEASAQRVLDAGARSDKDKSFADKDEARTFEAKINLLMQTGQMQPEQIETMMKIFKGDLKQMDTVIAVGMRLHSGGKVAELASMLQGVDKKTAKSIMISMVRKSPAEFDRVSKAVAVLQRSDGMEIDMEATIKTIGMPGLVALSNKLEAIEKMSSPITKEAVVKFGKDNEVDVQGIIDNWSYYGELKPEIRKEAIQTYTTLFTTATSFKTQEERLAWANLQAEQAAFLKGAPGSKAYTTEFNTVLKLLTQDENGNPLPLNDYKAAMQWTQKGVEAIFGSDPKIANKNAGPTTKEDTGGKKEDPLDFLDSLAMRIKMVRDQSFNAKKPIESMLAAFTSPAAKKNVADMFKAFDGVQQKLIALKVPEEFRDYIAGLDAEQFDALTKADLDSKKKGQQGVFTYEAKKDKKGNVVKDKKGNIVYDKSRIAGISAEGKAIIAAYNEAPLDKFNIAQTKVITDTDNQFKAFNKLKAAGVDTATALEMVGDSALAGAIASKQFSSAEIEKFAKDTKNAAAAMEKAAVMADLLKKNADFEFKSKSVPKLASALKQTGMSVENIETVLSDPALAKQLLDDLADGKIDSKAIADYLNSIKEEKIVEIRGKFNAGDFAAAAAPGMELVNRMFSAQEALIRTGVDGRSTAMVARLKDLKEANENLQLDIQKITFNQIRPIEKAIETATRDLEIKVSRKIEVYQEEISDLQRVIEIAFERPIAAINAENTIMSNDMEIMNHTAEQINKRYDEQAEALSKVSEIKSEIVAQEKEQLDLADALSKGDIGAAARAIQGIRAANAARNAENASKALELSRKNKIDNLRGRDSGLTKDEITERQYQNAQATYDLENRVTTEVNGKLMTRLQILDDIQKKNDEIYKLEEDREARQLAIRNMEDEIYQINKLQIEPKQDQFDANNLQIAIDEDAMENLVANIKVLGRTKDVWDGISAKIEASSLAGQDFDGLMGTMLASVDEIDKGWKSIEDTLSKYSSASAAGPGTEMDKLRQEFKASAAQLETLAKAEADKAAAAIKAAQDEYKVKKDIYDLELAAIKAAEERKEFWLADMLKRAFDQKYQGVAPVAPVSGPTTSADNPNANYNNTSLNAANDIYRSAVVKGPVTSDAGGKSTTSGSTTGGSGTGGSGGSTNTVPGPGQKTPPTTAVTTPQVTGTTGTGSATISALSEDKIFSTNEVTPITDAIATDMYRATTPGLTKAAERIRLQMRDIQIQIDKDFPQMFMPNEHISTALNTTKKTDQDTRVRMLSQVKDPARVKDLRERLDKIMALKDEYRSYSSKDEDGKKVVSLKATEAAQKASMSLPPQIKELLDLLKNRSATFKADKEAHDTSKKAYVAKAKDFGYDENTKMSDIKKLDPEAYKVLLPLSQAYDKSKSTMEYRELIMNKARKLLTDAGYTMTRTSWYFGDDTTYMNRTSNGPDYSKWKGYATGGLVSSQFAQKKFRMGTDTVPAMLTPGEFVMNKFAVQSHGVDKMKAINNGKSAGDAVYNYSISVNVKSESNPDEIARTVIAQIKSVDAQKVRGVRI